MLATLFCAFFVSGMNFAKATVIYVDPNGTGADGRSWATAWQTLTDAAVDLAAENGVVQGGHTVMVAQATYPERLTLDNTHSGINGARNVFIAPDRAKIDPDGTQAYCLHLNGAIYLEFEKFDFTGATAHGMYLSYSPNPTRTGHTIFRYCNIYGIAPSGGNVGSGVYSHTYRQYDEFHNCNFILNAMSGAFNFYLQRHVFQDCIFLGNGHYGIQESRWSEGMTVSNCIFYANGRGALFHQSHGLMDTEELLNSEMYRYVGGNNIIANPGFADLSNWDFSVFYENSPALNAASHGGHIGVFQPGEVTLIPVSNKTYYVAGDTGDDGNSGESEGDAWKTVAHAGVQVRAGDTAIVKPGIYSETLAVTAGASEGSPITFRAEGEVVLDGTGLHAAVAVTNTGDIVFDGFIIKGGTHAVNLKGGFACVFTNCVFQDATSAGVNIDLGGAHEFTDSEIAHNTGNGLEALNSGGVTIQRCAIHDNNRGINLDGSSWGFKIFNSLIYSNRSHGVYHFVYNRDLQIENCTIFGNAGSGLLSYAAVASAKNTIFAENGNYGAINTYSSIGPITAINCLFYNNASGEYYSGSVDPKGLYNTAEEINSLAWNTNNIVGDPLLRNPWSADFRLRAGSPCINAGTNDVNTTTDFYGRRRRVGNAVDIGAFEMPPGGILFFGL